MNRISQVSFRVDASLQIGTGHVMRCLALADALRDRGAQCSFVCRAHIGHMGSRIRDAGHEVVLLPRPAIEERRDESRSTNSSWLGARWEEDAEQTIEGLRNTKSDWLVVDHYALDARWEHALRRAANCIFVIDDLADRPHDCDVLLDQNLRRSPSDYTGLVPPSCEIVTGPMNALLRSEFAGLREQSLQRRRSSGLAHVMISMGGIDANDATSKVVHALDASALPADCRVSIVMGQQAPWISSVIQAMKDTGLPGEVLAGVSDMAGLMADCDLAIGAAGSTSWERCTLGVPAILFTLADNQVASAEALGERGAAIFAGGTEEIRKSLPSAIAAFMAEGALEQASQAAARVTDGRGCGRIATMISMFGRHESDITVRAMGEADLEDVRTWRNAPAVRSAMYSRHEIGADEHRRWFQGCASDSRRHLLVVERHGIPLGFVQFHETGAAIAEWGFYAAPPAPPGSGTTLCRAALIHAFGNIGLCKVEGQAIATNERSVALHRKLGFTQEGTLRKRHFDRGEYVDVLCFGLLSSEFSRMH